jgi:hypothetical protein
MWPIRTDELDAALKWLLDVGLRQLLDAFGSPSAGVKPAHEHSWQVSEPQVRDEFRDLMETPFGTRGCRVSSNINTADAIREGERLEAELMQLLGLEKPWPTFANWINRFCQFMFPRRPNIAPVLAHYAVITGNTAKLERDQRLLTFLLNPHVRGKIHESTLRGCGILGGNPWLADRVGESCVRACQDRKRTAEKTARLRAFAQGAPSSGFRCGGYRTIDDPSGEEHDEECRVIPREDAAAIAQMLGWTMDTAAAFGSAVAALEDDVQFFILSLPTRFLTRIGSSMLERAGA